MKVLPLVHKDLSLPEKGSLYPLQTELTYHPRIRFPIIRLFFLLLTIFVFVVFVLLLVAGPWIWIIWQAPRVDYQLAFVVASKEQTTEESASEGFVKEAVREPGGPVDRENPAPSPPVGVPPPPEPDPEVHQGEIMQGGPPQTRLVPVEPFIEPEPQPEQPQRTLANNLLDSANVVQSPTRRTDALILAGVFRRAASMIRGTQITTPEETTRFLAVHAPLNLGAATRSWESFLNTWAQTMSDLRTNGVLRDMSALATICDETAVILGGVR